MLVINSCINNYKVNSCLFWLCHELTSTFWKMKKSKADLLLTLQKIELAKLEIYIINRFQILSLNNVPCQRWLK